MRVGVINANPGSVLFHLRNNKIVKVVLTSSHAEEIKIEPFSSQFREYLSGNRKAFDIDYILEINEFVRRVLNITKMIPYGKTMNYGQVAKKLGKPGAARAVGQALKRNPIPIIIPCHRVLSKKGLGGFSAGIEWKDYLCSLEASSSAE